MISSLGSNAAQISSSIFSKLDSSNKGYIAESDLQSAFEGLGDSGTDVSELFSSLDGDSDGKVSESELSSGISQLLGDLNSQFDSMRVAGGMPPPPPPPAAEEDAGYTEDELQSIASTTSDSNLASLMTQVANNFEAADSNEDGKVSAKEAMEYQRQQEQGNLQGQNKINQQMAQLVSAYGAVSTSTGETLNLAA